MGNSIAPKRVIKSSDYAHAISTFIPQVDPTTCIDISDKLIIAKFFQRKAGQ